MQKISLQDSRRKKQKRQTRGYIQPLLTADNNEVMKKIENKELRNEIVAAINELPDKCKLIFKLSYLQEMKNKTIAEMMGCSQRTVEAHVYKALKILRNKLDNLYVLLAIFSPYKINDFFERIVL